jgi:hypothetical protein
MYRRFTACCRACPGSILPLLTRSFGRSRDCGGDSSVSWNCGILLQGTRANSEQSKGAIAVNDELTTWGQKGRGMFRGCMAGIWLKMNSFRKAGRRAGNILTGLTGIAYLFIFNRNWVDTRWQQYSTHSVDTRWQQYSTHVHTNCTQNTGNGKYIIKRKKNGKSGPCPVFASYTLTFELQLRKSTEKPRLG